jgi:hypothetical protein
VEDAKKMLLNKVFFQPWQDGGVIITQGTLPLEGLLPLSGLNVPARGKAHSRVMSRHFV